MRTPILVLNVLLMLTACTPRSAPDDTASVPDSGPPIDNAEPVDITAEILPPSPTSLCPIQQPDIGPSDLLPTPRHLYRWGKLLPLAAPHLRLNGHPDLLGAELASLAVEHDLSPGDGGLEVTVHSFAEWESFLATCGLVPEDGPEAFFLSVTPSDAGFSAHLLARDDAGLFYAFKRLESLLRKGDGGQIREAVLLDRPGHPVRGVIEGFYGTPWTHEARLALLREMAGLHFNHYVYAPKGDENISLGWRFPFPPAVLQQFGELAQEARRQRIRFCLEMHILWGMTFSGDADLQTVADKFDAAATEGVDCFVLAFDDTNKGLTQTDQDVYADYTAGQIDFANRLAERLAADHPDSHLVFVPVEYWSDHPDFATDGATLGQQLSPAWDIAWTGPQIVSATITTGDGEYAAQVLQRPPLLGDNYPVSDDAQVSGRVHLGPLVGREPDLANHLTGIAFNAMPLPFASLPALATAADWTWNPTAYDPEDSLRRASLRYGDGEGADALHTLCRNNRSPLLESSPAPALAAAIQALFGALDSGDGGTAKEAAESLRSTHFNAWQGLAANFQEPQIHPSIVAELAPWAERLEAYFPAADSALNLLLAQVEGTSPDAGEVDILAAQIAAFQEGPRPTGDIMLTFFAQTLERLGR
jgi:hyaluronoglucosaminidase